MEFYWNFEHLAPLSTEGALNTALGTGTVCNSHLNILLVVVHTHTDSPEPILPPFFGRRVSVSTSGCLYRCQFSTISIPHYTQLLHGTRQPGAKEGQAASDGLCESLSHTHSHLPVLTPLIKTQVDYGLTISQHFPYLSYLIIPGEPL